MSNLNKEIVEGFTYKYESILNKSLSDKNVANAALIGVLEHIIIEALNGKRPVDLIHVMREALDDLQGKEVQALIDKVENDQIKEAMSLDPSTFERMRKGE